MRRVIDSKNQPWRTALKNKHIDCLIFCQALSTIGKAINNIAYYLSSFVCEKDLSLANVEFDIDHVLVGLPCTFTSNLHQMSMVRHKSILTNSTM